MKIVVLFIVVLSTLSFGQFSQSIGFTTPFLVKESDDTKGTRINPIIIKSVNDLEDINLGLDKHYVLGNDINFKSSRYRIVRGRKVLPFPTIGTVDKPFTGSFSGNGYTISHFVFKKKGMKNSGLFGYINEAHIKDVTFDSVTIEGSEYCGIVSQARLSEFDNVNVHGLIVGKRAGGIIGKGNHVTLKNCSFKGEVKAYNSNIAGGLVGTLDSSQIDDSFSNIMITGNGGGLAGSSYHSNINNSYALVYAKRAQVGGLVYSLSYSKITNCYANGILGREKANNIGGLVSRTYGSEIENCYFLGKIKGYYNIGNFYGSAGKTTVKNCFSTAKITIDASSFNREQRNKNVKDMKIENSFVVTDTILEFGAVTKTTEELMNKATFKNWDFDSIWEMGKDSYPRLKSVHYFPSVLGLSHNDVYYKGKVSKVLVEGKNSDLRFSISKNYGKITNIFMDSVTGEITVAMWKPRPGFSFQGSHFQTHVADEKNDFVFSTYINTHSLEGEGTEDSPYLIDGYKDLEKINKFPNAHYKLVNDIDASWSFLGDFGFQPMCKKGFTGTLDGNGYTIKSININMVDRMFNRDNVGGLFTSLNGATIKNLRLDNFWMKSNYATTIIAARSKNSVIENCSFNGILRFLGGTDAIFIGKSRNDTIRNCRADVKLYAKGQTSIATGTYFAEVDKSVVENSIVIAKKTKHSTMTIDKTKGEQSLHNSYFILNEKEIDTSLIEKIFIAKKACKKWDFKNVWSLDRNADYPELKLFKNSTSYAKTVKVNKRATITFKELGLTSKEVSLNDTTATFKVTKSGLIIEATKTGSYFAVLKAQALNKEMRSVVVNAIVHNYKGKGTVESPFEIATFEELQDAHQFPNSNFIMKNDINAIASREKMRVPSRTFSYKTVSSFMPIGTLEKPFRGVFDGGGFTISNLHVDHYFQDDIGMFGHIVGAEIKNLHITKGAIKGKENIGGIAGASRGSKIINCSFSGVVRGTKSIGGIVGMALVTDLITSQYKGTVKGGDLYGGIVGIMTWKSYIDRCSFKGRVITDEELISNLLDSERGYNGTIAGILFDSRVENSYTIGGSKSKKAIGKSEKNIYFNSYISNGTDQQYNMEYFTEPHMPEDSVFACYYDSEKELNERDRESGDNVTHELRSEKEMKSRNTYKGWDFKNVWNINENENGGYPFLR